MYRNGPVRAGSVIAEGNSGTSRVASAPAAAAVSNDSAVPQATASQSSFIVATLPSRPSRRQCNESPWPAELTASAREAQPPAGAGSGTRFLTAGIDWRYEKIAARSASGEILVHRDEAAGGRISRPRPRCRPVRDRPAGVAHGPFAEARTRGPG